MINALPYILLTIFYGVLAVYHHQINDLLKRRYVNTICILAFLFFFGFRGFVFYDWAAYYPMFQAWPTLGEFFSTSILKWGSEPGFTFLGVLSKTVFPNYHFFAFICSAINLTLMVRFFRRYSDNMPLSFMLFLAFSGIGLSTDLMRNSLSILIFANSVEFIHARKPLQYFGINLLGMMFHYSAVFFLPLYFFLHRSYSKWFLMALFVAANAIYLLHIPILKSIILMVTDIVAPSVRYYLDSYTKMDSGAGFGIGIGYLERLLTGGLLFCYMGKLRSIRPENNIFINCVILYLFLFLMFSEFRTVSARLSNLFSLGYWIIWADLLRCFTYRNNRLLYAAFVGIYCILKVYGICKVSLANYENILFGSQSYNEHIVFFRQHSNDKTGI